MARNTIRFIARMLMGLTIVAINHGLPYSAGTAAIIAFSLWLWSE